MDSRSDAGDLSFMRHEELRDSLMPLVNDAIEKVKKQFLENRASATFTNAVKTQTYRDSDAIRVIAELDGVVMGFENMSVEQMKFTLQSYADKTKSALQDSAMNLDRVLSLQSKLTASETSNKRLSDSLANLEQSLITTLETVAEREVTRISALKETDQLNLRLNSEKKALSAKLNETTKQLNEKTAQLRQLEYNAQELKSQLEEECRRANKAADELTVTRRQLEETRQREESLRQKIQEVEESRRQEVNSKKRERDEAQSVISQLQRKIQAMEVNHAKELSALEAEHKREQREVFEHCKAELEKGRENTKNSIAHAVGETKKFRDERDLYYGKYKELLADLAAHKERITSSVQAKLVEGHRKMFSDINAERARTNRAMQKPLPDLPSPHVGPNYLADLHSSADSSDHQLIQNENIRPPPQAEPVRRGVPKVARSYSAVGRFPGAASRR